MIDVDPRYRSDLGVCCGGRVEPSAEAGFENGELDIRLGKGNQRNRRELLEKGRNAFELAIGDQLFRRFTHDGRVPGEIFFGNVVAVYPYPLCDRNQVRRCVNPSFHARGNADRV